jgi:RNA polymerase sigma-70 factor (ECF subfamily)
MQQGGADISVSVFFSWRVVYSAFPSIYNSDSSTTIFGVAVAVEGSAMTESAVPFGELLERARQDDNDALAKIVALIEPELLRAAHNRISPPLRPYLESIDLVQSVHKSILISLRNKSYVFDGPEDLIALAVTMVVRKASRMWRKVKRDQENRGLVEQLLRRRPVADDPTARAEREDQVRDLLGRLSDEDRLLIELHLEDCGTREIAARLNTAENIVRARRSKLFRRLREEAGVDLLGAP